MLPWFLVPVIALGHLCLGILAVNITHGVPFRADPKLTKVRIVLLSSFLGIAGWFFLLARSTPVVNWPPIGLLYLVSCLLTATVGLPVVTVARWLRKIPKGITGVDREIDLSARVPDQALSGAGLNRFWRLVPANEAFRPRYREWEVPIRNLPTDLHGLSILHLTDLHLCPSYGDEFYEAIFEFSQDIDADLVLFTGDMIDDCSYLDRVEGLFGKLEGRVGNYAILGNHDYAFDTEPMKKSLRTAGFEFIEGRWTQVEIEGVRVSIGGHAGPWGAVPTSPIPPESDFSILLSHTPDQFHWAAKCGIDFMLCGHTHAGQYRLPLIGPVVMPSIYSRRYDQGFFQAQETLMYVSAGIAGEYPLRVNCPPELTKFELRCPISHERLAQESGHADDEQRISRNPQTIA